MATMLSRKRLLIFNYIHVNNSQGQILGRQINYLLY
jgi:hypothetical protein